MTDRLARWISILFDSSILSLPIFLAFGYVSPQTPGLLWAVLVLLSVTGIPLAYLLIGINVKPADAIEIQASYQLNFSQQRNYGSTDGRDEFVYGGYDGMQSFLTGALVQKYGGNFQNFKGRLQHKVGLGLESRVHEMLILSCGK